MVVRTLNANVDQADEVPVVDASTPAGSRAGDLWLLGEHRLLERPHTPFERRRSIGDNAARVYGI